MQVADRFHLWKNLCEAAEKTVAAHHYCLRAGDPVPAGEPQAPDPPGETAVSPQREYRLAERTRARFAAVYECLDQGLSRAAVSRQLNLNVQTVRRFAAATSVEELLGKAEHRVTRLGPFIDLVNQRWNEGITNAGAIFAELRALGFTGTVQTIRRYLRPLRPAGDGRRRGQGTPAPGRPAIPKPRHISRALLTHPDHLTENDALILKSATAGCEHLDRLPSWLLPGNEGRARCTQSLRVPGGRGADRGGPAVMPFRARAAGTERGSSS